MRPIAARVALAALAGGSFLVAPGALGQAGDGRSTEIRKTYESTKGELERKRERERDLEKEIDADRAEREKLMARLLEAGQQVQRSEGELTSIEARLRDLEADRKKKQEALNKKNSKHAKLLSALLRMGRNPPPVMITRREDALAMVRSATLLGRASNEMTAQAKVLIGELDALDAVENKVVAERDRQQAEVKRHSDSKIRLAGLVEMRKQSLSDRRAELDKLRAEQSALSKTAGDLSDLIKKMDEASRNAEREAYEAEARRQAAAQPAPAPPSAGKEVEKPADAVAAPAPPDAAPAPAPPGEKVATIVTLPPKTGPGATVELAPHGSSLVPGNPGRITPAIAFHKAKAKLPLPAQGRRVLSFGDKTQYGGNSKGIVIETRFSAQITSPCDGWIVYAGEFRSYGQLLIINAGGGYHVLMAGLSQIDVQPGQFVLAAEPVGLMSGAPKVAADAQSSAPVLYVEFRKDGDPIDPEPWWVESQRKAQTEQKVQG